MKRVAIIAALPGELRPLVRGWDHQSSAGVELWQKVADSETEWIAACAGIGAQAARRALAEIETRGAVQRLLSVGWAGALQEKFRAGQVYPVGVVIDSADGARLRTTSDDATIWLVTSERILTHEEKKKCAEKFGAGLVDMEAAPLARLAAERGIPFVCVKGVSDGLKDRLPDFARFVSTDGRFHTARFIFHALARPWQWAALLRLGRNSQAAAERMSSVILDDLEKSVG